MPIEDRQVVHYGHRYFLMGCDWGDRGGQDLPPAVIMRMVLVYESVVGNGGDDGVLDECGYMISLLH